MMIKLFLSPLFSVSEKQRRGEEGYQYSWWRPIFLSDSHGLFRTSSLPVIFLLPHCLRQSHSTQPPSVRTRLELTLTTHRLYHTHFCFASHINVTIIIVLFIHLERSEKTLCLLWLVNMVVLKEMHCWDGVRRKPRAIRLVPWHVK